MEDKKEIKSGMSPTDFINNKNLKPFLSVLIVLIVILVGYYFFWRSISLKMKNSVESYLTGFQYDSIEIKGFPFMKKVEINNINFSTNSNFFVKNQVNVKKILLSSFIFSTNFEVELDKVTTIDSSNNFSYDVVFNESPTILLGFYSDGKIKDLKYSDIGYRVINAENDTLYTADKSSIDLQSIRNDNTIDYSLLIDFQNMQNIKVLNTKNEESVNIQPVPLTLTLDLSTSVIYSLENEIEDLIIKINKCSLLADGKNNFALNGEIRRDVSDPYFYGNLEMYIYNFIDISKEYEKGVSEILDTQVANKIITEQDKKQYLELSKTFFVMFNDILKKNPKTTDNLGVLNISREKNSQTYFLNDVNLENVVFELLSKAE